MNRYEIETTKEADPEGTRLLRRAFARVAAQWAHVVDRIEVSGSGGGGGRGFVIVMHVAGPRARVPLECERLFAAAWYDAFGPRGSTHIGSLAREPGSRFPQSLAA